MLALATCLWSLIMNINLAFFIKKTLIYTQHQKLQKNYLLSSKIWWWLINKTFIMLKNFKSKLIIRELSPKTIHQARRSGKIANTSKLSKIASWKLSFFGSFQVLYLVGKQAYKLKLLKKKKIYKIFYISLLEEDLTKKTAAKWYIAKIWGWQ